MKSFKSIEDTLSEVDSSIIYKTKKSIVPGLLLLLIGISFFIPVVVLNWPSHSAYPPLLMVTGAVAFIIGFFRIVVRHEFYVSATNGLALQNHEISFEMNETSKLVQLITSGKTTEIHTLKKSMSGGLKVKFTSTSDGKICFSQVIAYDAPEYVALTAPTEHTETEGRYLLQLRKR